MKAPTSATTSATKRLRKVDTRRGRHKLDGPLVLRFFSAVSVNRLCPLGAVSQAIAPDACAPTVSAQFQRVYVDLLVGVPELSNRSYVGKLVCALHRGLRTGSHKSGSCSWNTHRRAKSDPAACYLSSETKRTDKSCD